MCINYGTDQVQIIFIATLIAAYCTEIASQVLRSFEESELYEVSQFGSLVVVPMGAALQLTKCPVLSLRRMGCEVFIKKIGVFSSAQRRIEAVVSLHCYINTNNDTETAMAACFLTLRLLKGLQRELLLCHLKLCSAETRHFICGKRRLNLIYFSYGLKSAFVTIGLKEVILG